MDLNNARTWSVLIVDDEPDNLEVVSETLHFRGAQVKTASNGKVALDMLKDFHPTLMLLDLSMPMLDGWEVCRRVKADPANAELLVVALTAHAMPGDRERVLAAGFDGYLAKPIDVANMLRDIRNAIQVKVLLNKAPATSDAVPAETPKMDVPVSVPEAKTADTANEKAAVVEAKPQPVSDAVPAQPAETLRVDTPVLITVPTTPGTSTGKQAVVEAPKNGTDSLEPKVSMPQVPESKISS